MTADAEPQPAPVRRLYPAHELSDLGNARRFVEQHGADVRFDYASKRWLVWDGNRFTDDDTGEVERRAKQTAQTLLHDAAKLPGDRERRDAGKHALHSMNAGPLRNMVSLAATEPGIVVRADDLDADPMLLNVSNGLLDLRTGQLRPHERAALCTKLAPVPYYPDESCPTFLKFLEQVLNGDRELIEFVQRLAGYSLTGDTREQVLPVLHGTGRNGKSTLVETLRDLLGDYATTMPPDLLVQRRGGQQQPHGLITLRGARFVAATETDDGARLSVALVKQLTGSDTITARHLYAEFVDFRPQAKFWLSTNHKPIIRDTTISIWRRVKLLPFTVTIPEEQEDKTLPDQLRGELPGILTWAVQGCLDWQQHGLGTASAVQTATADYRADSDQLGAFIDEHCITGPAYSAPAGALFAAWQHWANVHGEHAGSAKALAQRLTERGYEPHKGTGGMRTWRGIGLLTNTTEDTQ
jgi:putative DNA primase/helicase